MTERDYVVASRTSTYGFLCAFRAAVRHTRVIRWRFTTEV